jgi:hypothetical protein
MVTCNITSVLLLSESRVIINDLDVILHVTNHLYHGFPSLTFKCVRLFNGLIRKKRGLNITYTKM